MALDLVNYAFIRGKWYSFPNKQTAQQAIQKYNGNVNSIRTRKPVGVLIDETLLNLNMNQWPDVVVDAPGVTGDALVNPPVNVITRAQEEVETPVVTPPVDTPSPSGPSPKQPVVDPWAKLDQTKLNLAKRYADAGMMGRASSAFKDAGGVWDRTTSQRLRKEAGETSRYGGDFDFNWSNYGVTKQTQLDEIAALAKQGNFKAIKAMVEGAGGTWSKDMHVKLAAEYLGKSGTAGEGTTPALGTQRAPGAGAYKGAGPVSTPQLHEQGTSEWRKQFKGPIETGAWKTGQARKQAKEWRRIHMAKSPEKKKKIQRRFTRMIGAGEFAD